MLDFDSNIHKIRKEGGIADWLKDSFPDRPMFLFFNHGPDVWEIGEWARPGKLIEHLVIGSDVKSFDRRRAHLLRQQVLTPHAIAIKEIRESLYGNEKDFTRKEDDDRAEWKDFCHFVQRKSGNDDPALALHAGNLKKGRMPTKFF